MGTLMNAGTPVGQLAACFVLPVEDALENIFAAIRDAALVHRSGGRRRAANMAVMDVHHPDIETFITAKRDSPGLRTFNLSVACDDAFMSAATRGDSISLLNLAWTLDCKGITVYRQGTRNGQVLGPAAAGPAQCPECATGSATPISQA
jgi:ribonucleotide reductase alpha subunit